MFPGWEAVVGTQCGSPLWGEQSPWWVSWGAVGMRVCSCWLIFKECFSPTGACWNLSLISLLVKQPFNVACNYTPRCLLFFVLMLPVLKVRKNTSLLHTFCTRKKHTFNPASYNMVKIASSNCNCSYIIYWRHIQENPWCNFVLATLGGFYYRFSLKLIFSKTHFLNVNIKQLLEVLNCFTILCINEQLIQ